MSSAYPASLKTYSNGHVGISFADVPEAITGGATAAEALDNVTDALVVALSGYLDDGRALPDPGRAKPGQPIVCLPSLHQDGDSYSTARGRHDASGAWRTSRC